MIRIKLTMAEIRALNAAGVFVGPDRDEQYSLFDCPLAVRKEDISKVLEKFLKFDDVAFTYMSFFPEHSDKLIEKLTRASVEGGKSVRLSFPLAVLVSFLLPKLRYEYNEEDYKAKKYKCLLEDVQFKEAKKMIQEIDERNKRILASLELATSVEDEEGDEEI